METPIHVALIGAGSHSTGYHAPALQAFALSHPDTVRLAAVCDLDGKRAADAARRFGFEASCSNSEALFAERRIDAAIVVLPIPVMRDALSLFFNSEIPLLIEKPLGRNIAETHEIQTAAKGQPVMVSLNRRFDPGLRRALGWTQSHGPIRAVHGVMLRQQRTEADFLWSTGIHLLDSICSITGALRVGSAVTARPVDEGNVLWHHAVLTSDDGVAVTLTVQPTAGRAEERLRLCGNGYCVDVWTGSAHPWRVEAYADGTCVLEEQADPDVPGHVRNGTYAETAAFLEAVVSGRPLPAPSIADAMVSHELAARLSAESA